MKRTVHPHACGEHPQTIGDIRRLIGSSPRLWGTYCMPKATMTDKRFIPTPVGNIFRRAMPNGFDTVHPHACGEHIMEKDAPVFYRGSSPRLWGTFQQKVLRGCGKRFIPTPVGNIRGVPAWRASLPVHPHACGEHVRAIRALPFAGGSSPRLWGTFAPPLAGHPSCRFIPTPVGNIDPATANARPITVHPHACGEHIFRPTMGRRDCGSSPRLWGTSDRIAGIIGTVRFIPTPVGNIAVEIVPPQQFAVHPHACGEHIDRAFAGACMRGSSPRLWGTWYHLYRCDQSRRFIPTPVGNIGWVVSVKTQHTVHPHACGEHDHIALFVGVNHGSSPRLWGTSATQIFGHLVARFIPTPVGNMRPDNPTVPLASVHPHACGEHTRKDLGGCGPNGSSPRLWGTFSLYDRVILSDRFIPTPVGNICPK